MTLTPVIVAECASALAWAASFTRARRPLLPSGFAIKVGVLAAIVAAAYIAPFLPAWAPPFLAVTTVGALAWINVRLWINRRAWTHNLTAEDIDRLQADLVAARIEAERRGDLTALSRSTGEQIDRLVSAVDWQAQARAAGWSPPP